MHQLIIFLTMLALPSLVLAGEYNSKTHYEGCLEKNANTTISYHEISQTCLSEVKIRTESKLKETYTHKLEDVKAFDNRLEASGKFNPYGNYKNVQENALVSSQEEFLNYMKVECSRVNMQFAGNSYATDAELQCEIELMSERIKRLNG